MRIVAVSLLSLATVVGAPCATTGGAKGKQPDLVAGLVLDPEGNAVPFAKVQVVASVDEVIDRRRAPEVDPTGSKGLAVTDQGGRWVVDGVSADDGTFLGLPSGWTYEVTVYKAGFHIWQDSVLYEKGTLQVGVDTVAA